jgi:type III restriction enzyme
MAEMDYDPSLVETVATTLDLRTPNRNALDALARALDTDEHGVLMVADLATGVGKTYIAAALLDYLYGRGVRNVVIVTPGTTIQRKTIANLTPGQAKYVRGLQCRPFIITLDNFETGAVAQAFADPREMKVFVFTVQSLLKPDTKENRRAHRPHETLGRSLSDYLQSADDLVIIADEHHIYAGEAKKFGQAIADLDPVALVGLTATPDPSTPEEAIVFRYSLAEAIADGYVKIPVLVGRPDVVKDTRTQMADAVALLDAKAAALKAWCEMTSNDYVAPILFVVAQTIAEANDIKDALAQPDLLGSSNQVLLITSKEPDTVLPLLDALEEPTSPFRAVVSVSMLKEGWDVKNIYVIASVRAMESQLLTEQVLGRGLRLPFGHRTGVKMLDTVEVLSHHSFKELLSQAQVLLSQTLGERTAEAAAVAVGTSTALGDLASFTDGNEQLSEVDVYLPGLASGPLGGAASDDEETTGRQVGGISTVTARLEEAAAASEALRRPERPRNVGDAHLPIFIPALTQRWVRERFSLKSINTVEVEALGRDFVKDSAPTLTRKVIDAERTAEGNVEVHITDESADAPFASVAIRLPIETIEGDLTSRIVSSNAVEQSISEANAASGIARAFLKGAGVDGSTLWRPEHARLATGALVQWLATKQSAAPAKQVTEVRLGRWPEGGGERVLVTKPTNRNKVTDRSLFERWHPYDGWSKTFYPSVSFDSWSAEFRLAELLDVSPQVKAWTRVTNDVPLAIAYSTGAASRMYIPDFIVIGEDGVYWIVEGKADSEMSDVTVLAKRDAAVAWIDVVKSSGSVGQKWGYVLVSESAIGNASDWRAVLAASFTHR